MSRWGARRAVMAVVTMAFASMAAAAAESVAIRYTGFGIPHVRAAGYEGAGYGLGYAFARDNLCITLDLALTLSGERSAAFGEDEQYLDPHLGSTPIRNLDSDIYAKLLYDEAAVASMRAQLSADGRALIRGYVRGFNFHLASLTAAQRPQACRGNWIRRLTEDDIYRRINQIAILQSTHMFARAIVGAQPPSGEREPTLSVATTHISVGSNMAAFGRRATENGRGLSFSNPHFPWNGPQRFYAAQLTVPGRYDVFGAMLYGTPFILLGFNKDVGWSITYSTNERQSIYALKLVPGNPTSYVVDGKTHALQAVRVTVPVRTATGRTAIRSRTLYRNEDGPVIDSSDFPWTAEHAFIFKDANRDLGRWPDQFLELGRARTVLDIKSSAARIRGMMFSNVTAADRRGDVLYANFSPSINVPDEDLKRCLVANGQELLRQYGLIVLDGTRAACAWRRDGDAVDPQILPARRSPWVLRDDYVLNANDSHWIINADPKSALEGFDRVVGPERYPLGDRTRTSLRDVERRLAGEDGLPGDKMTLDAMRQLHYRGQTLIGESVRAATVRDCHEHPIFDVDGGKLDMTRGCEALAAWDGTARPHSRGGVLAREFIERLPHDVSGSGMSLATASWRVPFDPARPIETPSELVMAPDVRKAFAEAALSMQGARVPWDAYLRDVQYVMVNGQRVPIGGFPYTSLRYIPVTVPEHAWHAPAYIAGDSYMHAVTFDETGPVADFALSYSQSTDPASDHSWDLTLAYAQGRWVRLPFLDRDIQHDPDYQRLELEAR